MYLRFFSIAGAALLAACAGGPEAPHHSLTGVDALRSAFNADSGKIRAIFLASPT
jgi:hypothetical protein